MNTESKRNLDWDAVRYIAGEMESDECADFERLLAESQPAREAVAEAVELTQAVKVSFETEPVVPASSPSSYRVSSWWLGVAMGSAACLLVMLGLQQVTAPKPDVADSGPADESTNSNHQDHSALAARWSEVRLTNGDPWADLSSEDQFADSLSDWDTDAEQDSQAAPEWMMAAVSA